jgi:hypothetical protein
VDFANSLVKLCGYLVGVSLADVARDGKAISNQPLALGFAPPHDLITIHYFYRGFGRPPHFGRR